jgi:hypothetical protein
MTITPGANPGLDEDQTNFPPPRNAFESWQEISWGGGLQELCSSIHEDYNESNGQ